MLNDVFAEYFMTHSTHTGWVKFIPAHVTTLHLWNPSFSMLSVFLKVFTKRVRRKNERATKKTKNFQRKVIHSVKATFRRCSDGPGMKRSYYNLIFGWFNNLWENSFKYLRNKGILGSKNELIRSCYMIYYSNLSERWRFLRRELNFSYQHSEFTSRSHLYS